MTSNTEARATALADHRAAYDQAQQVYRDACEGPVIEYVKATASAKAEFDAATDAADRAYLQALAEIGTGL